MDTAVKLIVGLGNPGSQYHRTRHNAGADFVSGLAEQAGTVLKEDKKFFGLVGKQRIDNRDVRLLIPTTFMNRSGQAVAALANFYNIDPQAILVAHDELDLAPGTCRLKIGGGHGGHNGLRDIIQALGNCKNFGRLRLGIGRPSHSSEVVSFVLRKAPASEHTLISDGIHRSLQIVPTIVAGQWNDAMKTLHTQ